MKLRYPRSLILAAWQATTFTKLFCRAEMPRQLRQSGNPTMAGWRTKLLLIAGVAALAVPVAKANPILFSDSFQSSLNDGNWITLGSAQIVTDPLNSSFKAMTFATGGSGGNLFSNVIAGTSAGTYTIGFYFYANCGFTSQCGAYIGIDDPGEMWEASDDGISFPTPNVFADPSTWTWETFTFTTTDQFNVKLEDFSGSPHNAPDVVYFKDLEVVSGSSLPAPVLFPSAVPEPGSIALFSTGLLSMAGVVRKRFRRI